MPWKTACIDNCARGSSLPFDNWLRKARGSGAAIEPPLGCRPFTLRPLGRLYHPKRRRAPTCGHEDDVKHDVAPRTEEVAVICAVGVGEEEGQRADRQPSGSGDRRRLTLSEKDQTPGGHETSEQS